MARQYGGKTGPFQNLSATSPAPGSWIASTEVYRQRTAGAWPIALPGEAPQTTAGSIVFAASSGVVNSAVTEGSFTVASGGVLNRTTDSALFNVIGTTYGSGNGSTTFNVPNMYDKFIYFKGATASGTTPVVGSGQLGALHTHTFQQRVGTAYGSAATNWGYPNTYAYGGTDYICLTDVQGGTTPQNELRKRAFIPLVCKQTAVWPIGCVMPLLWPSYSGQINIPSTLLICSGQAVSRTTYATLYERLGHHYGAGNGSTTFNLPDLRGLFLSAPREVGRIQPSGSPASYDPDALVAHRHIFRGGVYPFVPGNGGGAPGSNNVTGPPASTSGGLLPNESRAANISVIWAIQAN